MTVCAGKEMMLNTDMCLVWTNDYQGRVDMIPGGSEDVLSNFSLSRWFCHLALVHGMLRLPRNAATAPKYGCNCAWVGPLEAPKARGSVDFSRFQR